MSTLPPCDRLTGLLILGHLSLRGQAVLEAGQGNQHPAYQKLVSQPKPAPPPKDRVCRKRIGSNVGRGHRQTVGEWFQALAQHQSGKHRWSLQGPNLECADCGLKLLHTKPRAQLEARSKVPCGAKEKVTFDGVHPTHQLRLCKQRFQCEMCGGLVSATTPEKLPEILRNSCSFYRKFPPKQAPKVQVQTTSLHTFYVGSATGSQT